MFESFSIAAEKLQSRMHGIGPLLKQHLIMIIMFRGRIFSRAIINAIKNFLDDCGCLVEQSPYDSYQEISLDEATIISFRLGFWLFSVSLVRFYRIFMKLDRWKVSNISPWRQTSSIYWRTWYNRTPIYRAPIYRVPRFIGPQFSPPKTSFMYYKSIKLYHNLPCPSIYRA